MGLPPDHPFLDGIFQYKPSSYGGTPICGNPHMVEGVTDYFLKTVLGCKLREFLKWSKLHADVKWLESGGLT